MQVLQQPSSRDWRNPVVLVSPPFPFMYPLSYGYLAAYLLAHDVPVRIAFRPADAMDVGRFADDVVRERPPLVAFGSLYPDLEDVRVLVAEIRRRDPGIPLAIGGPMVSPIPDFALKITGADFGVIGEGEVPLLQLVEALRSGKPADRAGGLAIREGNRVSTTGPGGIIEDLADLPRVPYDLVPKDHWLHAGRHLAEEDGRGIWRADDKPIFVHSVRGCPLDCNFCYHHSRTRYRPLSLVMREAAEVLAEYDANMLCFVDDLALPTVRRARELVASLSAMDRQTSYIVSATFGTLDRIDDDTLEQLAATGCRTIGLGFESGSDRILSLIGKDFDVCTALRGIVRLRKAGIIPAVMFMLGQLTETRSDVEATLRTIQEVVCLNPLVECGFSLTTPFPGSRLYDHLLSHGMIVDHMGFFQRYFALRAQSASDYVLAANMTEMDDNEVLLLHRRMLNVYVEEKKKASAR